jgi:hypothetical protein
MPELEKVRPITWKEARKWDENEASQMFMPPHIYRKHVRSWYWKNRGSGKSWYLDVGFYSRKDCGASAGHTWAMWRLREASFTMWYWRRRDRHFMAWLCWFKRGQLAIFLFVNSRPQLDLLFWSYRVRLRYHISVFLVHCTSRSRKSQLRSLKLPCPFTLF